MYSVILGDTPNLHDSMTKQSTIDRILKSGLVAIIRADSAGQLTEACEALIEGGVDCIEVTMTTPGALEAIREASQKLGDRICIGVGSVLDVVTARLAILAGAEYVVTPVVRLDVITMCQRYSKPVFCGAMTPTEALTAHEAGADFVKIFPSNIVGPAYIAAIKGPLPQLRIVPTGGVDEKTCGDFIKAGCCALGVGGSLVTKEILRDKKWDELTSRAKTLVAAVNKARGN
jgi:2-dehydro-3-deoxyphosphogluconate aldolase/(4S)-4-hydroxy-2-oxoglutarate aldolase